MDARSVCYMLCVTCFVNKDVMYVRGRDVREVRKSVNML